MKLRLKIWRQESIKKKGAMVTYDVDNVSEDMSFLEMLDVLNEQLIKKGDSPVAFDHDCREGICGSCSMVINGQPHGPESGTTACQLHMRSFNDGDELSIEPWRARSFPIVKDLSVDRSAFDRIVQKGGYITANTGSAQDANATPITKKNADEAFYAATCIGCGACVAACKNSSAMLFVSAKVAQFTKLPQGQPERDKRVLGMVGQHDAEGFGNCTNTGACEASCPKNISVNNIALLNREYLRASFVSEEK